MLEIYFEEALSKFPEKPALVFEGRQITYAELNRRVNSISDSLLKLGLNKGDRVAVLLHNLPEFIELYFASAKAGTVFVPINNLLSRRNLTEIFEYIKPRALIFDRDFGDTIQSVLPALKYIEFPVEVHGGSPAFKQYEELVVRGEEKEPNVRVSDSDLVSIFLTSGTTGRPKGAMRTHSDDLINAMTCAIEAGIRYDDRALLLFPFYHITYIDNMRHFLMSNTIVIRREGGFNAKEVLGLLSKEEITVCQFVPTMINVMLQEENLEQYDLSRFRLLMYAASPMPLNYSKKP